MPASIADGGKYYFLCLPELSYVLPVILFKIVILFIQINKSMDFEIAMDDCPEFHNSFVKAINMELNFSGKFQRVRGN